ncbi:hypothetical protein [Halocatena marina]|uniref:hypothetical protein n=1 Tax=Halocatena marina TaxID=2934937 RepID=UPI00200F5A7E|nr:hypothetical protein [Halocatena marina]
MSSRWTKNVGSVTGMLRDRSVEMAAIISDEVTSLSSIDEVVRVDGGYIDTSLWPLVLDKHHVSQYF